MARSPMKIDERADVFRALANPWRRAILDQLRAGPQSVAQLHAVVDVAQPTLSSHLGILRECGLVEATTTGTRVSYQLKPAELKSAAKWLAKFGS